MRFRSILFLPATRLDRFAKAQASGTDWVMLDLEDGVAPQGKPAARRALASFLSKVGWAGLSGPCGLGVRINPLTTAAGLADMAVLLEVATWPGMIALPKVESAKEIQQLRSLAAEAGQNPVILVTFETAFGLENAAEILRDCGDRVAVGYGSADHTAETGSSMSAAALGWARGRIVNACALRGIPALDGVCLEFRDMDRLRAEAELVKDMGFAGKIAIHPAQITPINAAFTPSAEQVETARAMIDAHEAAGGGAFSFNGKMVDGPVLAQAYRTVSAFMEDN